MQTQKARSDQEIVWSIDPAHSTIEVAVRNLWSTLKGSFGDLSGTLRATADGKLSSVVMTIKAAGLVTGNSRRDESFRSTDLLAADRFPEIQFQTISIGPGRDRDTLRITGLLTIKDATREVVLEANKVDQSRAPHDEEVVYYAAITELDRFDFGIRGRPALGRKVKVSVNIQASRRLAD